VQFASSFLTVYVDLRPAQYRGMAALSQERIVKQGFPSGQRPRAPGTTKQPI